MEELAVAPSVLAVSLTPPQRFIPGLGHRYDGSDCSGIRSEKQHRRSDAEFGMIQRNETTSAAPEQSLHNLKTIFC